MVGRNAPCPCGSGKKYKRCCLGKDEVLGEQIIKDDISRIMERYFESLFKNSKNLIEIESTLRTWNEKLQNFIDEEDTEGIVIEYFGLIVKSDEWRRYLLKVLNNPLRTSLRKLLESWHNPIILFGRVTDVTDSQISIEEVLGHEKYIISIDEKNIATVGQLAFGVAFKDKREKENGLFAGKQLLFLNDFNGAFSAKVEAMAKKSGHKINSEFLQEYMPDIYKEILSTEEEFATNDIKANLTYLQYEVLSILVEKLTSIDCDERTLKIAEMIAVEYLLGQEPSFRKPAVISAAVFKEMDNFGLLNEYESYSQGQVAKMFGVSVSSYVKHLDNLEEVIVGIENELDNFEDDNMKISYSIGTDPLPTERTNWELHCNASKTSFDSYEELEQFVEMTINTQFVPNGDEQLAQQYAYDAYDAGSNEEKARLTDLAYNTDPNNVDANLLKAELADDGKTARFYHKKAIKLGEKVFDGSAEIAWSLVTNRPYMRSLFAYGIWFFDNKYYKEALKYWKELLKINPSDNQGVRYLAIATYLKENNLTEAEKLLNTYEESYGHEAAFIYLSVFLELKKSDGKMTKKLMDLFAKSEVVNPHFDTVQEKQLSLTEYPNRMYITPGSKDEAQYITYLL